MKINNVILKHACLIENLGNPFTNQVMPRKARGGGRFDTAAQKELRELLCLSE